MPGTADSRLDDNLAQQVIKCASLGTCQTLSLSFRRLCKLVRSTRTVRLHLNESHTKCKEVADLPASRTYERVGHISFAGEARVGPKEDDRPEFLPAWCRLCRLMGAAVQRWPGVEHITIHAGGWEFDITPADGWDGLDEGKPEVSGYLMGAVMALQEAPGLRSLTIDYLANSCSLQYLPLLTQLTELRLTSCEYTMMGLVVGGNGPLADMTGLRVLSLGQGGIIQCDQNGDIHISRRGHGFRLCEDHSVEQAELPPVLPPNLTQLELVVPMSQPGMFWIHIAACSQLVSLTVDVGEDVVEAEDHPSWMLCCLANSLPNLQQLTIKSVGLGSYCLIEEVLALLADTEAGQQQEEERGWDWEDIPAPGLASAFRFGTGMVPPPNMGGLTALRSLDLSCGDGVKCCGPHHWHALAECSALQQLHGLEAWAVPPAGVKFPGVTDLQITVSIPPGDTVAVLGAFPALQQLRLKMDDGSTQQITAMGDQEEQGPVQQVAHGSAQPETALLLGSLTQATFLICGVSGADSPTLWHTLWRAMPALQRLKLEWPYKLDLLQQLPPTVAFTGLTSLALSTGNMFTQQRVDLQVLLGLLQGANQLEKLGLMLDVRGGAAGAGAGSSLGGSSSQGGSGSDSSRGGGDHNIASSCSISRDSLLGCLQQTLPSLRHLLSTEYELEWCM